jgi:hypothetical protein
VISVGQHLASVASLDLPQVARLTSAASEQPAKHLLPTRQPRAGAELAPASLIVPLPRGERVSGVSKRALARGNLEVSIDHHRGELLD